MTPPRQDRNKNRWQCLACLVALFAVVYGASLWLVDDFGSPVPFWDEWNGEGGQLFKKFLLGQLPFSRFFVPHNEHRIVLARLLEFGLFWTGGMWDPRLEMVVNATIAAGTATLVAYLLVLEIGEARWRPVIFAVAVLWVLPYAWENTLCGFQSQVYFLVLFSFVALWGTIARSAMDESLVAWNCLAHPSLSEHGFRVAGGIGRGFNSLLGGRLGSQNMANSLADMAGKSGVRGNDVDVSASCAGE